MLHFDFAASEAAATQACDNMLIFAILQVPGVAPWPVEAGPQFIHGAHSSLQVCAQQFHAYAQSSSWTARHTDVSASYYELLLYSGAAE